MFRPASRALLRAPTTTPVVAVRGPASRRLVSTASSESSKSRGWKNTALRVGLAVGAVYYYNTSNVFADLPSISAKDQKPQSQSEDDQSLPTLSSIKPKIREQQEKQQSQQQKPSDDPNAQPLPAAAAAPDNSGKSPQELEEEAGQEAAFNPETGEINWDCPCLGGMAHGPCGEEFKAAFSCFVYSNEEPKGIDCIEKFKGMQDCFRAHPDVYGAELEDDEPSDNPSAPSNDEVAAAAQVDASSSSSHPDDKHTRAKEVKTEVATASEQQGEQQTEGDQLIPKAWHDQENKTEK